MRLSDIRLKVRRRVRALDKNGAAKVDKWTDDHIDDYISMKTMDLYRRRSDAEESYGKVRLVLDENNPRVRQVHTNLWEYYVPSWVHTIQRVRELKTTDDPEGLRVRYSQGEDVGGWDWDQEHVLTVRSVERRELVL